MKQAVQTDNSPLYAYLKSTIRLICFIIICLLAQRVSAQSELFSRSVSNTIHCNNSQQYGVWLDLDGYNNYYRIHDASFVEFDDGTARLTGTAKNNGNNQLQFDVDVRFGDRQFQAPSGSPKNNWCGSTDASDWYYYTQTSGTLTGKGKFAGAIIHLDRMGEAFQVGIGANVTSESHLYGASGWLTLDIQSQPTNGNYHISGTAGDINIMLGGEGCDNLTDGGVIGETECSSTPFDPALINNLQLPSGGNNQPIEYVWLRSTNPELPIEQWEMIANSNAPTFDPGLINETTYYLRCARRFPCEKFLGESNIIAKIVQPNPFTGSCITGIVTEEKGVGKYQQANRGVQHPDNLLGNIDGMAAQFYDEGDKIIVELDKTLTTGETYTISWKYRQYTSSFNSPAQLRVFESADGVNFTFNSVLQTNTKSFFVHSNLTAKTDARFIRLENGFNTPDFDVDAITFSRRFCQQPTICKLNDHGISDQTAGETRLVWIKFEDEGIQEYSVVDGSSKFTQFPDGTALLTGTIERLTDNCFKYNYSVRLVNRSNWTSWSAQGKTFKGGPFEDHTNWIYYDIDEANSQFYGAGCHIGELLDVSQRPVDRSLGFQIGNGANLKNAQFGLSGWFALSGDRTAEADFNGNIDDCVEQGAEILLGDRVWEDLNANGLQDDGEPGIDGVTATLIGLTYNGQGVIQTTSTQNGGAYQFGPLLPGRYKVIFNNVPGGFFATALNRGPDLSIDSDVDPVNGMTASKIYGGADNDFGIDAGYFRFADIGNLVWEDLNGNGVREANEPGIAGVQISLSGTDGLGEAVSRSGQTDAIGIYFFDRLTPGSYKVTFSTPAGFTATAQDQGGDDTNDSDADPNNGMTIFETLESGEMNDTYDAGFFRAASLGGIVFIDQDNSGLKDAGDADLKDVKVTLLRQDPFTLGFSVYDMTTSQADGSYRFDDVAPGKYQILFDALTLPNDFFFTAKQNVDGNISELIDSDVDAGGLIEGIMVMSGQADDLSYGAGVVNDAILPVDLTVFNAQLINDNEVQLNWETASELNNNFFVIERSSDGENFQALGSIQGNGTAEITNYYDYLDESPYFGRNYYRLKQVDLDGSFEFSEVRLVIVQQDDLPDAIAYPNPTKDFTLVRAVKPFEADVTIEVLAITGELLQRIEVSKDMNSQVIDMRDLKAGFYFVQIRYDEFRKVVHKVLKIQD